MHENVPPVSTSYQPYNSALLAWWSRHRNLVKIVGIGVFVLFTAGYFMYESRFEIKARLQSWLVNEHVVAMQKADTDLSAQSRILDSRIKQVEEVVSSIDQQFANDRDKTVALQDQLKETVEEVEGAASPKASVAPKSPAAISPKPGPSSSTVAESSKSSEESEASGSGSKININSATVSQFDSLPGIGATYAQRIVEYREQNGAFTSVDDLLKVKGIGTSMLSKIRDLVEL